MALITQIAGIFQRLGALLYTVAAPTLTDGSVYPLRGDVNGNLLVSTTSSPLSPVYVKDAPLTPRGYQQLTVNAVAVNLTVPASAVYVLLQTEAADPTIRYRDDGVAPTAAVGYPFQGGKQSLWYTGSLSAIQFISTGGAATLNALFYS